ncbi:hypothetical protein M0534_05860 [Methylonatrum kenyense]|uniref:hypothetical protein n=1 Tax=Methylonatrum kenyense TaxID=455253 RepID=UPI0020BF196E|nr:hypothetical protein [Methylonatrum kenyense]MCK8515849.1 hypothetical protein [Methylonatrum kenyense]
MKSGNTDSISKKTSIAIALAMAGSLSVAGVASAQQFETLEESKPPLVLESVGSFYVGGDLIFSDALGTDSRTGHTMVNQMYVQYMVPQGRQKVPVVLVHGGGLSGKNYDTQPDGRMGWFEYFVREGYPTYIPDQAARGRSTHDVSLFNQVRAGLLPPDELPLMNRTSNEFAWTAFRFGPQPGIPFPDTQFPIEALDEFAKQQTTTLNALLPSPDPNWQAMAELAAKLDGAVLAGFSQSGRFPLEAALIDPAGIRGAVLLEPAGGCNANIYTDDEIATLATVPIQVVFGDHLAGTTWQAAFDNCNIFIERVNSAGGNAEMLYPPAMGIFGNSHMLMNDLNSDQIADLIIDWISENVERRGRGVGRNR